MFRRKLLYLVIASWFIVIHQPQRCLTAAMLLKDSKRLLGKGGGNKKTNLSETIRGCRVNAVGKLRSVVTRDAITLQEALDDRSLAVRPRSGNNDRSCLVHFYREDLYFVVGFL